MKKILLGLIVVAVMVVSGVSYLIFGKQADQLTGSNAADSVQQSPTTTTLKKACDVFTQADADAVLGGPSFKSDTGNSSDIVNAQTSVTSCLYKIGDTSDYKSASVLLRSSAAGEAKTGFESAKSSDSTDIKNLGDSAYWNPTYGQVNVLKGGTWMIVSVGGAKLTDKSQPAAVDLSARIVGRL